MSRLYESLESFFLERGIPRREDGGFAEDSHDFGVWWRDRTGGIYRLTWIGAQGRSEADAGELYLATLLTWASAVPAQMLVEFVCRIPPSPSADPERNAALILDGWAEECGKPGSIGWVRDRSMRAVLAGTATDA